MLVSIVQSEMSNYYKANYKLLMSEPETSIVVQSHMEISASSFLNFSFVEETIS